MPQAAQPAGVPVPTRITVEDFHRIAELGIYDKRAELIRGVVFQKPAMSPLHRQTTKRLYDRFQALGLPGVTVFIEAPLTLQDSEPLPDVFIASGTEADFRFHHPTTAELLCEVAVTSVNADREMAALYAEAGVQEYWIVLPADQQVEVHRRPIAGQYRERQIYAQDDEIVCTALPAIRVSLAALFA